jgi:flagellar motor switch protein FliM
VLLALPAEGRGVMPHRGSALRQEEGLTSHAFAAALAEQVTSAECALNAVLSRVSVPLSRIMGLKVGDVLALPAAQLDRVMFEGLDGRALDEGKLGQNRGMRALRLGAAAKTMGGQGGNAVQMSPEPLRQAG